VKQKQQNREDIPNVLIIKRIKEKKIKKKKKGKYF
jgi:hypothetical protein